jgi:hypothetical protein
MKSSSEDADIVETSGGVCLKGGYYSSNVVLSLSATFHGSLISDWPGARTKRQVRDEVLVGLRPLPRLVPLDDHTNSCVFKTSVVVET